MKVCTENHYPKSNTNEKYKIKKNNNLEERK